MNLFLISESNSFLIKNLWLYGRTFHYFVIFSIENYEIIVQLNDIRKLLTLGKDPYVYILEWIDVKKLCFWVKFNREK